MSGIDIPGDGTSWDDTIKIYTLDSVVKGNDISLPNVDGESNIPLRSLANRTQKIKETLAEMGIYVKDSEFKYSGQNIVYNAPLRGDVVHGYCVANNSNQFWNLDSTQTDSRSIFVGIADVVGGRVLMGGIMEIPDFAIRGYTPGAQLYASHITPGAITTTRSKDRIGRYLFDDIILISPAESQESVQLSIDEVVDDAPSTLNTLNKLAAAINDDPDILTVINNYIATKEDTGVAQTLTTNHINATNPHTVTAAQVGADTSGEVNAKISTHNSTNIHTNLTERALFTAAADKTATLAFGDFTPVLYSSEGTFDSVYSYGSYTKIGNMVTLNVSLEINNTNIDTDAPVLVQGCPYTALRNAIGFVYIPGIDPLLYNLAHLPLARIVAGDNFITINAWSLQVYDTEYELARHLMDAPIEFTITYVV